MANIREVDAIVHVVRAFDDENVMREQGREDAFVDPIADIDTINLELILADLESINKRYARVEKMARTQKDKDSVAEFAVLEKSSLSWKMENLPVQLTSQMKNKNR